MAVERIDGPGDARVNEYRAVPEPELVRSRGLFIVEGRLVVQRAIEDRRFTFRSVLVSDAAYRQLEPALSTIVDRVPVYICDSSDFLYVTGYNLHRGCLALVERPPEASTDSVLADARTVVVLEAVTNADNIGSVFRNAAAFSADGVLLSPTCCDPLYRKAIRTSMGATLRVPYARATPWPHTLDRIRRAGFTLVALTPHAPAEDLSAFTQRSRPERIALLVGTEGAGLSAAAEAAADLRVRIPIRSDVDSLNLAVAAGIALHALVPPASSDPAHNAG